MSSTRHADPGQPMRMERYDSSPEYEKGLPALQVSRRCTLLETQDDRDLVLFIHNRSWQPGGLSKWVRELLEANLHRVGTVSMRRESARSYPAVVMRAIRDELRQYHCPKPLYCKGEAADDDELFRAVDAIILANGDTPKARFSSEANPEAVDANQVREFCHQLAQMHLEEWIAELCLNPGVNRIVQGPCYFVEAVAAIRDQMRQARELERSYTTAFGSRVRTALEYALRGSPGLDGARPLTVIYGGSGTGKTHEAQALSRERPGIFPLIEVPSGSDDHNFFLALATGLGVSKNIRHKAQYLRERVEATLLNLRGQICLVLDESHRLFPQSCVYDNTPKRVEWVMSMAGKGVAVCLIASPQFFDSQGLAEDRVRWNTLQLERRIGLMETFDGPASREDIEGVAKALLPGIDLESLEAVVAVGSLAPSAFSTVAAVARFATYAAGASGAPTSKDIADGIAKAIQTNAGLKRAIDSRKGPTKGRRVVRKERAAIAKPSPAPSGRGALRPQTEPRNEFPNRLVGPGLVPVTT